MTGTSALSTQICGMLLAQIGAAQASEPLYDARVEVLGEYIRHHVKEEENESMARGSGRTFGLASTPRLGLSADVCCALSMMRDLLRGHAWNSGHCHLEISNFAAKNGR
jgi:hypothetical protein